MGTSVTKSTPPRSRRSTPRHQRHGRHGTGRSDGRRSPSPPTPPSTISSSEEFTPRFAPMSNPDPLRGQPAYNDKSGTIRMYFSTVEQTSIEPTSRKFYCREYQLLLKTDHEDLRWPRMRDIDLVEGCVPMDNLECIRRPWGIQRIMPIRWHADFDSMQYTELDLYAEKMGVRPGSSTRSVKRAIMRSQREPEVKPATDRQDLEISKSRASYLPSRDDYDVELDSATHNCYYVLKVQQNEDGTWLVMNIDGYSATVSGWRSFNGRTHALGYFDSG